MLTGASAIINTPFPGTTLGDQLLQVAKIIKLRSTTGMSRQVFFCSLGGFDTHGSQSWQHWDLLRQLSEALSAFYHSTEEMGIADRVTSFTLSDFGRTLQPSGTGTDHGWGSHHLIVGGAVQGGAIYGTFPSMALGGPDDSGARGALIPTTSTDQYGGTLAAWLGVPPDATDVGVSEHRQVQFADAGLHGLAPVCSCRISPRTIALCGHAPRPGDTGPFRGGRYAGVNVTVRM